MDDDDSVLIGTYNYGQCKSKKNLALTYLVWFLVVPDTLADERFLALCAVLGRHRLVPLTQRQPPRVYLLLTVTVQILNQTTGFLRQQLHDETQRRANYKKA